MRGGVGRRGGEEERRERGEDAAVVHGESRGRLWRMSWSSMEDVAVVHGGKQRLSTEDTAVLHGGHRDRRSHI